MPTEDNLSCMEQHITEFPCNRKIWWREVCDPTALSIY